MNRLSQLGAWSVLSLSLFATAAIAADIGRNDLPALVTSAVSDDAAVQRDAVAKLRATGPAGLAAILSANATTIEVHRHGTSPVPTDPAWQHLCCAIDAVAAQHDAYASGLYWYTDLDAAKAAARAQGKPILSLRLLGKLNEEFSCANSRFFRTALYANAEVSKLLRERFVLHWQSVRPVPRITIDFGDGRRVERTITGNSIHYVLQADGRVIDAIPGLYGPAAFLRELTTVQAAAIANGALVPGSARDSDLRLWHVQQQRQIVDEWQADLKRVGVEGAIPESGKVELVAAPPALAAAPRAISKGRVEINVVRDLTPINVASAQSLESRSDDATWAKLAALHADDARLDAGSRALIAAKGPPAARAAPLAFSKSFVERPLVRVVANFERSIAEDTVRNQYLFHRKIHEWLADAGTSALASDVNALNERVYAELFLTPSSDPWLGLVPADTYSALENDGLSQ